MAHSNAADVHRSGFFSTMIVRGLLVILPIWLTGYVLLKVLHFIVGLLEPVRDLLPKDTNFQNLIALLLVVVFCFLIGLVKSAPWGAPLISGIERLIAYLPGYRSLRSLIHSLFGSPAAEGWAPALIRTDETEQPGFVIERHEDGRFTVFVPGAPTPMSGDVHVIDGWRVKMLSAGTPEVLRVMTRFGDGAEHVKKTAGPPQGTPPQE